MTEEVHDLLPDPIDSSSRLSEGERQRNTELIRQKAQPKQFKKSDGTWPEPDCEECGRPISEKRLEATGALTCIACATAIEIRNKQHGRR